MSINFKINVKGLLIGSAPAVAVSGGGTMKECPTADLVSLEPTPECLFASANNGRVSVRNPIAYEHTFCTEYQFVSGGSVTIRASDLNAVIGSFDKDEVLLVETVEGTKPPLPDDATEEQKAAWEVMTGMSLRFRPSSDPEQEQTLPVLSTRIEVQVPNLKPDKEVVISRAAFVRACGRILFAGGFEDRREKFLYWVLRPSKNKARFIAGSGSRFAMTNMKGEGLASVGPANNNDLLIPVAESNAIAKVFGESACEKITIKHYGSKLSFECGPLRLVCVGLNPNIVWVEEDKIVNRTNLYKFVVPISELDMAVKGALATNSNEAKKLEGAQHPVSLTFDVTKGVMTLQSTRTSKKAIRKVKLSDVWSSDNVPNEIEFRCMLAFLVDTIKYADKGQFVQLELISGSMPMIARFYGTGTVSHEPNINIQPGINGEEDFCLLIANKAEAR